MNYDYTNAGVRFLDVDVGDTEDSVQQQEKKHSDYGSIENARVMQDEGIETPTTENKATKNPSRTSEYEIEQTAIGESYNFDFDSPSFPHTSSNGSYGFHLGHSTKMNARNIMVFERRTNSFLEHGDEYERVPTQLKNNIRLVEDVNLDGGSISSSKGRLYLARYSFFNNEHDLKFALTVPPNIYRRIVSEFNDAFSVPCGLYFCFHGGDDAHTGVSHKDYVDIKLAWIFFVLIIGGLLAIEFLVD